MASCKDSRILSLPAAEGDNDDVDQCKTVRNRQPELYITQKESQNFLQSSKLSDDKILVTINELILDNIFNAIFKIYKM